MKLVWIGGCHAVLHTKRPDFPIYPIHLLRSFNNCENISVGNDFEKFCPVFHTVQKRREKNRTEMDLAGIWPNVTIFH